MFERGNESAVKRNESQVTIPRTEWTEFLKAFSSQHHGLVVKLETHDVTTGEDVVSHETRLRSIDMDLEDERNPRINVTVEVDNKVLKHILFRPSDLVYLSAPDKTEGLRVDTVNTVTTVRVGERYSRLP